MSASNAVQMATSQPTEGEMSREEAMRGVDWRTTLHKVPAVHWGHLLYQHPDLQTLMDRRIGERRRVNMKDIEDVYDKLQDNSCYREFLIQVRNEIARLYGDQYYQVMDAPPPPTITAKTPRMVRSDTSGGGVIALRPGTVGTYI